MVGIVLADEEDVFLDITARWQDTLKSEELHIMQYKEEEDVARHARLCKE